MKSKIKTYIEERPWGRFEQFTHNQPSTVKIITVRPNEELSLQYHKNRDEFWRIIGGSGQVVIGEEVLEAKTGDEFLVPRGTKHRMITGSEQMRVLEIALGEFDEDDIVRLEDKYKRV